MSTQTSSQQRTLEDIHHDSLELAKSSDAIIPFMDEEVVRLEEESANFESGELDNAVFTPFRLRQGVYGQRQPDVQMIRVKIPGGILTPEAMEGLGEVSDKYAPLGKGHITTRENVQFHHIPLAQCPEVLRLLGATGLTTREACGNTVRNVVGSPYAGVDPDEVFDPTPYLAAYVRFGVRHPITQGFPRKFKSAFTGTDARDHVSAAIQDLTYVSQVRVVDGVEQKRLQGVLRWRNFDNAPAGQAAVRVRVHRRLPAGGPGYLDGVQQRRYAAQEPHDGPPQSADRPHRPRRVPRHGGRRAGKDWPH